MAKASSPIRLQDDLMKAAAAVGQQMHRSASEQIEYWASLGRTLSNVIDPGKLMDVIAGLATIEVRAIENVTVEFDDVFAELEADRQTGVLSTKVANPNSVRYQACASKPGLLERIDPDGTVTIGQFKMGNFIPS